MAEPRGLDAEQARVWRSFLTATTLFFDQIDDAAKKFDLTASEYAILVLLSETDDQQMRMARLADALCHSRSRVTHTVKRMEGKGLVGRVESDDDGRGVVARITDTGLARLAEAAPDDVEAVRRHLFDLASPEDLAGFARVLDAMADELAPLHPESDLRLR